LKAQVVEACVEPGASVAAIAMAHGVNANLVRRWMKVAPPIGSDASKAASETRSQTKSLVSARSAFLPVQIDPAKPTADIRIELRRGAMAVIVSWPSTEAVACGRWLQDLLR
jgi:transposase-like protein